MHIVNSQMMQSYVPTVSAYDEFLDSAKTLRPHWQPFFDHLESLGSLNADRMWQKSRSALEVSRRRSSPPFGQSESESKASRLVADRPWEVDAVPWILSSQDWQHLSAGLVQRATILDLTLADLYGPQRLVTSGVLPPELLYEHPAFHRSFAGLPNLSDRFLHIYAVDLARSPDGSWWVLSDRTDAALGLGYALENRLILSRTYSSIFHQMNIERYTNVCDAFQARLTRLESSIGNRGNYAGRTVILTEGPQHAGYFEDFYLANFLGCTLTQGSDLVVRDSRLWLKTIGGLEPVSLVFRRISDSLCDPLEQRSGAGIGCAGLTSVVRAGNVQVINPLGSSLVESSAFMAFLNPISQFLTGEKLQLNSLATWWCGQPNENSRVVTDSALQINSAFRHARRRHTDSLHRTDSGWAERLAADSKNYVGQETMARSLVPSWRSGELVPFHGTLRAFVVATDSGYQVLPGGLARVDSQSSVFQTDVLSGEYCKDVWVVGETDSQQPDSLARQQTSPRYQLPTTDIPSRVADNFLWLGRTVERVDAASRLLRTAVRRTAGEANFQLERDWPGLVRQLANRGLIEPDYAVVAFQGALEPLASRLPRLLTDRTMPTSLPNNIDRVLMLAGSLRDRLSQDAWECLLNMHSWFESVSLAESLSTSDVLSLSAKVIRELAGFIGLISDSMTRTLAWRFLDLGSRLERCMIATSLVSQIAGGAADDVSQWQALVEVADSSMTYRFRHLGNWEIHSVLNLLLGDEDNPRSVAYQLRAIVSHLEIIEQLPDQRREDETEDVSNLSSRVSDRLSEIQSLFPSTAFFDQKQLLEDAAEESSPEATEALRQRTREISTAVTREILSIFEQLQARYVSHIGLQQFN